MKTEIVVAIIAVIGVILSAIVSYFVSRFQANQNLKELDIKNRESYMVSLFEKRLEKYPLLYKLLSDLGKEFFNETINPEVIKKFKEDLDKWDSANAIFCSPSTLVKLLELRKTIAYVITETDYDDLSDIENGVVDLEMNLRTEISVFDVKDFHFPDHLKSLDVSWSKGFAKTYGKSDDKDRKKL